MTEREAGASDSDTHSNGSNVGIEPGHSGNGVVTAPSITLVLPHARRRRLRVRPRTVFASFGLLAVVVFCAILSFGWRHFAGLLYYTATGAAVDWRINRNNWSTGGVTELDFSARPEFISDNDLENLKYLNRLQVLDLSDCSLVTNDGLAAVSGLKSLRILVLGRSTDRGLKYYSSPHRLSDACLKHLVGLTELRELSLAGAHVTDDGLAQLAGLTELESIDLSETPVTDAGLEHLLRHQNLEVVNLQHTAITDAGLNTLLRLPNLKRLDLKDSKVTAAEIVKIMQARPTLDIWPLPEEIMPKNPNKVLDDATPR